MGNPQRRIAAISWFARRVVKVGRGTLRIDEVVGFG
jgi:hypothetical protein